jgi:hypothetical protein
MSIVVPAQVKRLLTPQTAREIARTYDHHPVYPENIVADYPGDPGRMFPGWPGPVLVLMHENQGVCHWGVPLDQTSHQVLVGGDLDSGRITVTHAGSVRAFIAVRRWDDRCLAGPFFLQAGAGALEEASLGYLRQRLTPAITTTGWPGLRQHRFEHRDARLMLWDASRQCDWMLTASTEDSLVDFAAGLLHLPDFRKAVLSYSPHVSSPGILIRLRRRT